MPKGLDENKGQFHKKPVLLLLPIYLPFTYLPLLPIALCDGCLAVKKPCPRVNSARSRFFSKKLFRSAFNLFLHS